MGLITGIRVSPFIRIDYNKQRANLQAKTAAFIEWRPFSEWRVESDTWRAFFRVKSGGERKSGFFGWDPEPDAGSGAADGRYAQQRQSAADGQSPDHGDHEFVKWPWVIRHYRSKKWLKNITRENVVWQDRRRRERWRSLNILFKDSISSQGEETSMLS